jgi:osmotically-inducible protein OsmY
LGTAFRRQIYTELTFINLISNDPRTKNAGIEVASNQGVVTLTGTVKSEAIREAAEDIARRQEGVVTVINELKVT